ncbi:hypothetical protein [Bacillus haynesii]|uniref:hypothetical protein n=1 Tax=Bacillus haynesii TaxID=1925021 RepID=UPI00227E0804|nr:hypothetical protein [Bacillus haynesii]MCY9324076.1 hypothetical protein [Bacillus haynesii]
MNVKPIFILNSADGLFYSPTIDVSGYETLKGVFVPQGDDVTLTIEVSDDGLEWTMFKTLELPRKYFSASHTISLAKSHIRFKASSNVATTLKLWGSDDGGLV